MTYLDHSVRRRNGSFDPFETAEVRFDLHGFATRFDDLHAEHVFAEPCRRPRCPSVRQAVTVAFVAVVAVSAVNVHFTGREQLVDPCGVFLPVLHPLSHHEYVPVQCGLLRNHKMCILRLHTF